MPGPFVDSGVQSAAGGPRQPAHDGGDEAGDRRPPRRGWLLPPLQVLCRQLCPATGRRDCESVTATLGVFFRSAYETAMFFQEGVLAPVCACACERAGDGWVGRCVGLWVRCAGEHTIWCVPARARVLARACVCLFVCVCLRARVSECVCMHVCVCVCARSLSVL